MQCAFMYPMFFGAKGATFVQLRENTYCRLGYYFMRSWWFLFDVSLIPTSTSEDLMVLSMSESFDVYV